MSDPTGWTVIDDTSPFIHYQGDWFDQSAIYADLNDPGLDPYYNRTYSTTVNDRAYLGIAFVGTKISIFGTLRDNHGQYSAMIDQDPAQPPKAYFEGYSASAVLNYTLFTADVEPGAHRVFMFNEVNHDPHANRYMLGIDAITFDGYPIAWESTNVPYADTPIWIPDTHRDSQDPITTIGGGNAGPLNPVYVPKSSAAGGASDSTSPTAAFSVTTSMSSTSVSFTSASNHQLSLVSSPGPSITFEPYGQESRGVHERGIHPSLVLIGLLGFLFRHVYS